MKRYVSVDAVMKTFSEEEKIQIYGLAGTLAEKGVLPLKEGHQIEDVWNALGFNEEQRIVANKILEDAEAFYNIKKNAM